MKIMFGRADASAARTVGPKTPLTSKSAPRMLFRIMPIGSVRLFIPGMVLFQTVSDAQRLRPRARWAQASVHNLDTGKPLPRWKPFVLSGFQYCFEFHLF